MEVAANMQAAVVRLRESVNGLGRERLLLLMVLTLGHVAVHWYQQLFSLVVPSLKADLLLTNVQVGTLFTARQITNSLTLPAGYLADSYRGRTNLILAAAILCFGLGFYSIGIAPSYEWTLAAACLIGLGSSLWHPAAIGSLSVRFAERRGLALSVHGAGASVGDSIAPIIVGAILLAVNWRFVLEWHLLPAVVVAIAMWWSLRNVYQDSGQKLTLGSYLVGIREMVTNAQVLGVTISNAISGMARLAVTAFFPLYVTETLGYSPFVLGIYLALLYVMGVVSQPIMGVLSDRYGRKAVLIPAFGSMAVTFGLIPIAPGGVALGLVIGVLGCFFYGTVNITTSAVMDVTRENVQSSTMGVTSLFSQPFSLASPIIAGFLVESFGLTATFWYAAVLQVVSTLILIPIRFSRPAQQ